MYQNIFHDKSKNSVYVWDDSQTDPFIISADKFRYAYKKCDNGTYVSMYGDKLEKVENVFFPDPNLFESDVPLDTRALIDLYPNDDEPSKNHRIVFYDIETSSDGGFPNVDIADKEITAIAAYSVFHKKYTAFILDKEKLLSDNITSDCEIYSCLTEKDLLLRFIDLIKTINPTILSGWNSYNFDDPYTYRRIKKVLGKKYANKLSPIDICIDNPEKNKFQIAGVSCIDYMVLYKKWNLKTEPTYALGAIGKKVVGIDKISFKGSLNELFKTDIKKYIDYNLNDVKILVALEEKLKFIEQARQICHKGHVPYECFDKSSRFLEGAILMYLRRKGQVAKNKPPRIESESDTFEGAFVKSPIPGRYEWVFDLDLTSMYPNIIISLNISPETKVGKVQGWNVPKLMMNKLKYVKIDDETANIENFLKFIEKEKYSIASNGVLYRTDFLGVIPEILIKWFDERKELRKIAKQYGDNKDWDKYHEYDQKQKIVKVQLNSIYGALGLNGWRFYDKDNASAVTLTGQQIIKTTDMLANKYFMKKVEKTYVVKYKDGSTEELTETELKNNNVDIKKYA